MLEHLDDEALLSSVEDGVTRGGYAPWYVTELVRRAELRGAQRERAKTLLDVAKRLEAMADEEGARDVGGDVAQARRSIAKQGAYLTAAAVVCCFDEDESGTHAKEEA